MTPLQGIIYESVPETRDHVIEQLRSSGRPVTTWGDLHHVPGDPVPSYWHQNLWLNPVCLPAATVAEAAAGLRSVGGLWTARPQDRFRRHVLIQERLPRFQPRQRPFPFLVPDGPLGAWSLKDDTSLWASPQTSSPFPGADPHLEENKTDPPSSAYRKLQEAFLLCRSWPRPGQVCLDAGSSPGGWTWVLAETGASVHSVDRAPLDSRLTSRPNVIFRQGNAFSLKPSDLPELDWFCSDVICYPAKLWLWLEPWIASGSVRNFVVTVKMQGQAIDWATLDRFAAVPDSRLIHLCHNKHELTWLRLDRQQSLPVNGGPAPAF